MKRKKQPSGFARLMAKTGCYATGIVYAMIGVIALLSLFKLKHGGADEASILRFLEDVPLGEVVVAIILLGMIAYIIWRFYEAANDPYEYGKDWKGILTRIITACSAVSDALIAWPAVEALLGVSTANKDGEPVTQRRSFGELLETTGGTWLVTLIGVVTTITAIVQFVYVFKEAYEERIDFKPMKPSRRTFIHVLSYAGHVARGIILGIMGVSVLKAVITDNAMVVVNTDKAFDFIGDHISTVLFALVALGTICYGLFMAFMGYYYDFRKGK